MAKLRLGRLSQSIAISRGRTQKGINALPLFFDGWAFGCSTFLWAPLTPFDYRGRVGTTAMRVHSPETTIRPPGGKHLSLNSAVDDGARAATTLAARSPRSPLESAAITSASHHEL